MFASEATLAAETEDSATYDFIIIGASYAADWAISDIAGRSVANMGVGGQQSREILDRFRNDVIMKKPNVVVIWGFINDIFRNPMSEIDKTERTVIECYREMIDMALVNGIQPVLATEIVIRPKAGFMEWVGTVVGGILGKESYQDRVNSHVRRINARLREMAAQQRLTVLDFESVLAGSDGLRKSEFSQDDGSHVSAAGYVALSDYAVPVLQNLEQ